MYVCMYRNFLKRFKNNYRQQKPIVIEEQKVNNKIYIFQTEDVSKIVWVMGT